MPKSQWFQQELRSSKPRALEPVYDPSLIPSPVAGLSVLITNQNKWVDSVIFFQAGLTEIWVEKRSPLGCGSATGWKEMFFPAWSLLAEETSAGSGREQWLCAGQPLLLPDLIVTCSDGSLCLADMVQFNVNFTDFFLVVFFFFVLYFFLSIPIYHYCWVVAIYKQIFLSVSSEISYC